MQVKSLTLTLPPAPEIAWPKTALRRIVASVENVYHRVFGCWHTNMSRPFTIGQETYRMCLHCGAHRAFDPRQWKMVGPYYMSRPRLETNLRSTLAVVHSPAVSTSHSLSRAA